MLIEMGLEAHRHSIFAAYAALSARKSGILKVAAQ